MTSEPIECWMVKRDGVLVHYSLAPSEQWAMDIMREDGYTDEQMAAEGMKAVRVQIEELLLERKKDVDTGKPAAL